MHCVSALLSTWPGLAEAELACLSRTGTRLQLSAKKVRAESLLLEQFTYREEEERGRERRAICACERERGAKEDDQAQV